ncbi:MAG: hypothetical protein Q8N31_23205 [Reyranella sp.]|nr:hypothetical protein [Reyranella sp.]MDP3162931.1 hypothetical protein [Reyranella sp.]
MCEPVTTTLMIGASVAQTALGVAQQAQQAQEAAAQQASRAWQTAYQTAFQTAQARNAATVSEYNAQDAERRGAVEEERQRRKTSLLLGTQQARFAAQGSDLLGSPLDLLGDTAAFGEEDALATRYQAAREAWNYRIQAANQTSQADFYANSAVAPLRNYDPGLGIAKSLLGGTTDLLGIAVKRGVLK